MYRVGIILGFISNIQLSSSLTNLTHSANTSIDNGIDYARDTVDVIELAY